MADLEGSRTHVLVVDDHLGVCDVVDTIFRERAGYEVSCVHDGRGARAVIASASPAMLLIESRLPDESGLLVAADAIRGELAVMLMTGDHEVAGDCEAAGAVVLRKPFRIVELISRTRALIEISRAARAASRVRREEASRHRHELARRLEQLAATTQRVRANRGRGA